jgi:tRNA(His) 5'-end guanylyltransferase
MAFSIGPLSKWHLASLKQAKEREKLYHQKSDSKAELMFSETGLLV